MAEPLRIGSILAAASLLGGCAHHDVQDMGHGQHSLTAVSEFGGGYAGSHEEAIQQANSFCGKSGQQAVIGGFYDKSGLGPLGEHYSTIIFNCAAPPTLHF
jgi:uncharacterized protein YcfJ